jgi:hypothetical protein
MRSLQTVKDFRSATIEQAIVRIYPRRRHMRRGLAASQHLRCWPHAHKVVHEKTGNAAVSTIYSQRAGIRLSRKKVMIGAAQRYARQVSNQHTDPGCCLQD